MKAPSENKVNIEVLPDLERLARRSVGLFVSDAQKYKAKFTECQKLMADVIPKHNASLKSKFLPFPSKPPLIRDIFHQLISHQGFLL